MKRFQGRITSRLIRLSFAFATVLLVSWPTMARAADVYWTGWPDADIRCDEPAVGSFFGPCWHGFTVPGAADTAVFGADTFTDAKDLPHNVRFGDFCWDFRCGAGPVYIPAEQTENRGLVVASGEWVFSFEPFIGSGCNEITFDPGDISDMIKPGTLFKQAVAARENVATYRITSLGDRSSFSVGERWNTRVTADSAKLTLQGSGVIECEGMATIGHSHTMSGELVLREQSRLHLGGILVAGAGGHGILNVLDGSQVTAPAALVGYYDWAGSTGSITIAGQGSSLDCQDDIVLGYAPGTSGSLRIVNGGTTRSTMARVGQDSASSSGELVVDHGSWVVDGPLFADNGDLAILEDGKVQAASASLRQSTTLVVGWNRPAFPSDGPPRSSEYGLLVSGVLRLEDTELRLSHRGFVSCDRLVAQSAAILVDGHSDLQATNSAGVSDAGTLDIKTGSTLHTPSLTVQGGELRGYGTIDGDLMLGNSVAANMPSELNPTVRPGRLGLGALTVTGDWWWESTRADYGRLWVQIGRGGKHGTLRVGGQASIRGGKLVVDFENGYQPVLGERFPIVQCGSVLCVTSSPNAPNAPLGFAAVEHPAMPPGLDLGIEYRPTGINVVVIEAGRPTQSPCTDGDDFVGNPDDQDGDGTPDESDGCATDPEKTDPGSCGCGESDADLDGDGLPDCPSDDIPDVNVPDDGGSAPPAWGGGDGHCPVPGQFSNPIVVTSKQTAYACNVGLVDASLADQIAILNGGPPPFASSTAGQPDYSTWLLGLPQRVRDSLAGVVQPGLLNDLVQAIAPIGGTGAATDPLQAGSFWQPVHRANANGGDDAYADPFRANDPGVLPLDRDYLAADEYLLDVDEVTLDNQHSAFYRFTFTLPPCSRNVVLEGVANVDDMGVLYLNGHAISPLILEQDIVNLGVDRTDEAGRRLLNWPSTDPFGTDNQDYFKVGENELVFAVLGDASEWDPTGLEFTAMVSYELDSSDGTSPPGSGDGTPIFGQPPTDDLAFYEITLPASAFCGAGVLQSLLCVGCGLVALRRLTA